MSQVIVKISEEDRNRIEALHYQVEARANLLDRLAGRVVVPEHGEEIFAKYMQEYEKCHKEYVDFKAILEERYKPLEIAESAESWSINFQNCDMIFEVKD